MINIKYLRLPPDEVFHNIEKQIRKNQELISTYKQELKAIRSSKEQDEDRIVDLMNSINTKIKHRVEINDIFTTISEIGNQSNFKDIGDLSVLVLHQAYEAILSHRAQTSLMLTYSLFHVGFEVPKQHLKKLTLQRNISSEVKEIILHSIIKSYGPSNHELIMDLFPLEAGKEYESNELKEAKNFIENIVSEMLNSVDDIAPTITAIDSILDSVKCKHNLYQIKELKNALLKIALDLKFKRQEKPTTTKRMKMKV